MSLCVACRHPPTCMHDPTRLRHATPCALHWALVFLRSCAAHTHSALLDGRCSKSFLMYPARPWRSPFPRALCSLVCDARVYTLRARASCGDCVSMCACACVCGVWRLSSAPLAFSSVSSASFTLLSLFHPPLLSQGWQGDLWQRASVSLMHLASAPSPALCLYPSAPVSPLRPCDS